ncbi:MAG: glycoside hydrolase family 38 C-terminal domain-containing protein [Ginsengibacter sp.]
MNDYKNSRRKFLKQTSLLTGGTLLFSKNSFAIFKEGRNIIEFYVVPNMHPASCGWLVNFCVERVYCANNYLAQMKRVEEDINYKFVFSEVNNMIAIKNLVPQRYETLKQQIKGGKAEIVNAFFCELTPNLSGAEAIIRSGVNGLKWYKEVLGQQPRFNWMIDIAGLHEQSAQITAGLGLEAQVHCRMNISSSPVYDAQSPDGTIMRTISPGHYFNWAEVFTSTTPLTAEQIKTLNEKSSHFKKLGNLPRLVLSGGGDYSKAPFVQSYPTKFIEDWKKINATNIKFTTFSEYFDSIQEQIKNENIQVPVVKKSWGYSWDGFWVENYKVKKMFREAEHNLYTTELLASIASIKSNYVYPSQNLYHAWVQLHLNSDRNSLWGAATGAVFEDAKSWDVLDRYNWIKNCCNKIGKKTMNPKNENSISVFNPLNWKLNIPLAISLPHGKKIKGISAQQAGDKTILLANAPAIASQQLHFENGNTSKAVHSAIPPIIETDFYKIKIDSTSGALTSLVIKSSGKELIGAASNIYFGETTKADKSAVAQGAHILPEDVPKNDGNIYHAIDIRQNRLSIASSKGKKASILYSKGPVAHMVQIKTSLYAENDVMQTITIYHQYPRIDFDIQLSDLADKTINFTDFNFAAEIINTKRGIPGGFATETPDELIAREEGIHPVIEWSSYDLSNGTSFAILDRALPGREVGKQMVSMMLYAASNIYMQIDGGWLTGKGKHNISFAVCAFDTVDKLNKELPKLARAYNAQFLTQTGAASTLQQSFFTTSENVIVQSVQRIVDELEIRFVECYGKAATATITLNKKLGTARLTNFIGDGNEILGDGPSFNIAVRPQQIVTLRIKTKTTVAATTSITEWTVLVPDNKKEMLKFYDPSMTGRPRLEAQ